MESEEIKIVNHFDLNEQSVVSFIKANFNPQYSPLSFIWQYNSSPNSVLKLAVFNGEIIGSQGFINHPLRKGNLVFQSVKSETTFVNPKYRGKALFVRDYSEGFNYCVRKSVFVVWGFTAISKLLREKVGFSIREDIIYDHVFPLQVKQEKNNAGLGLKQNLRLLRSVAKVFLSNYSIGLYRLRNSKLIRSKNVTLSKEEITGDDVSAFWKDVSNKHGVLVYFDMTKEFFDWRVLANPFIQYSFLKFKNEEGQLIGYCIYSVKFGKVYIADLSISDIALSEIFVCMIIQLFKTEKYCSILFLGNRANHLMKTIFSSFERFGGTSYRNNGMNLVFKNLEGDKSEEANLEQWYFNGLWTEGTKF